MFSIGEVVHVFSPKKERSSLCTILVNNDDGTFDVVDNFSDEEVNLVDIDRLCALEDWEVIDAARIYLIGDLSVLKERGNRMFSYYKDYRQALSYYKKAESLIRETYPILVFSEVLIEVKEESHHFKKTLDFMSGIVQDVEDDGQAVIAFDTLEDEEIEESVEYKALTALCPVKDDNNEQRTVQRSIYMNMARCYSKLNLFAWAIRYASLALAISKVLDGEYKDAIPIQDSNGKDSGLVGEVWNMAMTSLGIGDDSTADNSKSNLDESFHKMCADALLVRSRCLLSLGRLKLIKTDLHTLAKYRYTGSEQKIEVLSNEANTFRVQRFKSNKKMARHLGEWVQHSMLISEELKKQGKDAGTEMEVNALLMDDNEDD